MEKITADNFITDNRTNKVFISSLIDKYSGNLEAETRAQLKLSIKKFCPNCELLYNTMDVWARDYMPIQLTKDTFLSFTYKPDYLNDYPESITNWQLHNVHTQKQLVKNEHFDFKVVQIPIILDGGNFVKAVVNGNPCIIMCEKVLEENNVSEEDFCNWWEKWWKDNFDGTEMDLVLLPWEREDIDPFGHADGVVRYVSEGKVLLTNYGDYEDLNYPVSLYIDRLKGHGFDVNVLSYKNHFDYKRNKTYRLLFNYSWCYINYLQLGNRILVPSLGYKPLDHEALQQIDKSFNANGHIADIRLIDVDMTSIVEDMSDVKNSGGALNCLTWTIKE